jgi:hypothetical protein
MSESDQDTTFKYWIDWLDAYHIDYTEIPDKELINWINDMEECVGEFFMDMLPNKWLDADVLNENEWDDLPSEEEDD